MTLIRKEKGHFDVVFRYTRKVGDAYIQTPPCPAGTATQFEDGQIEMTLAFVPLMFPPIKMTLVPTKIEEKKSWRFKGMPYPTR